VSDAQRGAVTIRRPRPTDAAAIAAMMADPQVQPGLLQMPYTTEEFWRKRIEEMPVGSNVHELFVVAERDGQVIGNGGLIPMHGVRRRHAMSLGMAVARVAQGQGVGTALMQALIDWADRWAQVVRLELTVFTDNTAAIALYRKFGFEAEGTHRAYALRDGVYADVLAMARLHPSPPALR
jgi:L-phenylalanine/L-methionine N-acetyltransferase